ncbi:MAG: TlpA disulfide reductase family protein [Bacteroidota bacterium]
MAKTKSIKREVVEWIILIGVVCLIYFAGWHTQLIGKLQQAVLATGIMQPDFVEEKVSADYSFSLTNMEGKLVPFSDFQNDVVFLNFWATWCPPCIAEMPDIHELYKKQVKDISFVMVSLDKDRKKALEFVRKHEYKFPVYFLNSSLPKTYDVSSIPTTYVLGKDGLIKVKNHGMAKYSTESFYKFLSEL